MQLHYSDADQNKHFSLNCRYANYVVIMFWEDTTMIVIYEGYDD